MIATDTTTAGVLRLGADLVRRIDPPESTAVHVDRHSNGDLDVSLFPVTVEERRQVMSRPVFLRGGVGCLPARTRWSRTVVDDCDVTIYTARETDR